MPLCTIYITNSQIQRPPNAKHCELSRLAVNLFCEETMKCSIATWIDTVRAGPCLWFMLSKREYIFSFVIYCHLIRVMHTTDIWPLIHCWIWIMSLLLWRTLIFFFARGRHLLSAFLPSVNEKRKNLIRITLFEPLLTSSFIFSSSNFAWPFIIWLRTFCIVFVIELESSSFHRIHLKWFLWGIIRWVLQSRKKNETTSM